MRQDKCNKCIIGYYKVVEHHKILGDSDFD